MALFHYLETPPAESSLAFLRSDLPVDPYLAQALIQERYWHGRFGDASDTVTAASAAEEDRAQRILDWLQVALDYNEVDMQRRLRGIPDSDDTAANQESVRRRIVGGIALSLLLRTLRPRGKATSDAVGTGHATFILDTPEDEEGIPHEPIIYASRAELAGLFPDSQQPVAWYQKGQLLVRRHQPPAVPSHELELFLAGRSVEANFDEMFTLYPHIPIRGE